MMKKRILLVTVLGVIIIGNTGNAVSPGPLHADQPNKVSEVEH